MAILVSGADSLCNFGRGFYDEHFCIFEFGPVVKKVSLVCCS